MANTFYFSKIRMEYGTSFAIRVLGLLVAHQVTTKYCPIK